MASELVAAQDFLASHAADVAQAVQGTSAAPLQVLEAGLLRSVLQKLLFSLDSCSEALGRGPGSERHANLSLLVSCFLLVCSTSF